MITGAGGEFCSGADVGDMSSGQGGGSAEPARHRLTAMRHVGDVCLALHRLPQPTVAKVRGVAVGAGANLALVCDLVVAGETARFSEIFARRGLSIDFGGSWILPASWACTGPRSWRCSPTSSTPARPSAWVS